MKTTTRVLKLISFICISSFIMIGCRTETGQFVRDIAGEYESTIQCSMDSIETEYTVIISEIEDNRILIDNFGNLGQAIEVEIEEGDSEIEYSFQIEDFVYMQDNEEIFVNGFGQIYSIEDNEDVSSLLSQFVEYGPENEIPIGCIGFASR